MPETENQTLSDILMQEQSDFEYQYPYEDVPFWVVTKAVKKWLEQKKQYYEAQKELGADYWLYTHRQRVVDDLLKELER